VIDLENLKKRDGKTLERIYKSHRGGFLLFASRYNLPQEDILDVYQDAFVALIENAEKGKLDHLNAEIKTYLFSIGKYMIFGKLKKNKTDFIETATLPDGIEWPEIEDNHSKIGELELALNKLGEQCYKILRLFYYEEKKLDEIMELLPYQSKDVLKSQKARCLKHLKEMLSKN
jgi:RNA polymerase sigma factor (sigma-70 family)